MDNQHCQSIANEQALQKGRSDAESRARSHQRGDLETIEKGWKDVQVERFTTANVTRRT